MGVGWHGEPGATLDSHQPFSHDNKPLKELHGFVCCTNMSGEHWNTWWRMIQICCNFLFVSKGALFSPVPGVHGVARWLYLGINEGYFEVPPLS